MSHWETLKREVFELEKQCMLNVAHSFSRCSESKIQLLLNYSQTLFSCVLTLIEKIQLSPNDIIRHKLRNLIAFHFSVTRNKSLDCFNFPSFELHTALLKVSKLLVNPCESVITILFPSVCKILGEPCDIEENSLLSCVSNDDFNFSDYCMSEDGISLISLKGFLSYSKVMPEILFQLSDHDAIPECFVLETADRQTLLNVLYKNSEPFMRAIEVIYQAKVEKKGFGYELEKLKSALIKSSKVVEGSELIAREPIYLPVLEHFYQYWNSLPNEARKKAETTKAIGTTLNLKDYLHFLFFYHGFSIAESEIAEVENHQIFHCAHQIGEQLDSILQDNPKLYENLEKTEKQLLDSDTLQKFYDDAISNLPARKILLADEGLGMVFSIACEIIVNFYQKDADITSSHPLITKLARQTENRFIFSHILSVLPRSLWPLYIGSVSMQLSQLISYEKSRFGIEDNDASIFCYMLLKIPVSAWSQFIGLLDEFKLLSVLLTPANFSDHLNHIPKRHWKEFSEAVKLHENRLIISYRIVKALFGISESENRWDVLLLYKDVIIRLFERADSLVFFMLELSTSQFPKFMELFQIVFKKCLNNPRWLVGLFQGLMRNIGRANFFERRAFRKSIFNCMFSRFQGYFSYSLGGVAQLLHMVSFDEIGQACQLILEPVLKNYVGTFKQLNEFLSEFSVSHRFRPVIQFLATTLRLKTKISSQELISLLKKYSGSEIDLLTILSPSLPDFLKNIFIVFEEIGGDVFDKSAEVFERYCYLIDNIRVVLLSQNYLLLTLSTESFLRQSEEVQKFLEQFVSIENSVDNCFLDPIIASHQKLFLLYQFMSKKESYCKDATSFIENLEEKLPLSLITDIRNFDNIIQTKCGSYHPKHANVSVQVNEEMISVACADSIPSLAESDEPLVRLIRRNAIFNNAPPQALLRNHFFRSDSSSSDLADGLVVYEIFSEAREGSVDSSPRSML